MRQVRLGQIRVSIPQSGFGVFGQMKRKLLELLDAEVSIPQSGFGVFGLARNGGAFGPVILFQSLSRDSVCLDGWPGLTVSTPDIPGFNPSVGIRCVWTRRGNG